jgi:hypothetical protein
MIFYLFTGGQLLYPHRVDKARSPARTNPALPAPSC